MFTFKLQSAKLLSFWQVFFQWKFQNSDWPFYWLDFSLQGCIAVKSQAKLRCFRRPLARPFSQLSVSHFGLKGFLKGKEDKSWRENCFSSSLLLIPSKLELSLGGFAVRLFGKKKKSIDKWAGFPLLLSDLPDEGPVITGGFPRYHIGDKVEVNCTSKKSKPAAKLKW